MTHKVMMQLNDVLAHERKALIEGQYDTLADLAVRKSALLDKLGHQNPAKADLRHLKMQMDINQDLIAAALRGVASAKERIRALEHVRDGLRTYDQAGQVALVAKPTTVIEKKA